MKNFKLFLTLSGAIFSVLCFGCSKKDTSSVLQIPVEIEEKKNSHSWFYFSENGYNEVSKIQDVMERKFEPWTEAVRISSANCAGNFSLNRLENIDEKSTQNVTNAFVTNDFVTNDFVTNTNNAYGNANKAFAVVNRLGILCFEGEKIYFAKDENLFSQRTAGNLVFLNETPIFSLYKSSFFNDTISEDVYKNDAGNHLFLVQFDSAAKISYPIINCSNIFEKTNSEVTDFVWDGYKWICSIKTAEESKIEFNYVSFTPNVSLLTLSPATAGGNLSIKKSSADEFRNAKRQIDYSNAPERVKSILSGFSKKTPFVIEVKTVDGTSPREYLNKPNENEQLKAKAILAESWSAALFEDGTMFIEGALQGKHILRGGKPVALRLPVLPQNFVYSDFVISGTTLYAAWEESSFYKTGRSGFLRVNLDETLYKKLL